ncbi:MAG: Uma2 family endonuclease [Holophaga sp.]|nr:Uma2 family endonuclease [Holophaga sp.]
MSLPQLKHPGYTIEDWKSWEGRWELINGVPYDMTPAPNVEHQRVSRTLTVAITTALEGAKQKSGSGECEAFAAPIDLFLPGEESVYQPDLLVVCDPSKIAGHGIVGVPDLVVEILSPSTASKDMTRKRWSYEAAGIPEYLIVDPDERVAVLLRLKSERYEETARVEWGTGVALLGGKLAITLG